MTVSKKTTKKKAKKKVIKKTTIKMAQDVCSDDFVLYEGTFYSIKKILPTAETVQFHVRNLQTSVDTMIGPFVADKSLEVRYKK